MRHSSVVSLLLFVAFAWAIEHDSICDENSADCPDPSHVVVRLPKRDDARAAAIAEQHGMRVVGRPFLDSHYFLEHLDDSSKSRRHKRETVQRIRETTDVEWVEEQRPKRRVKRDYVHVDESADGDRYKRSIPRLPWPDPLYPDQWYLVCFYEPIAWKMSD
jgi:hypothetical protein